MDSPTTQRRRRQSTIDLPQNCGADDSSPAIKTERGDHQKDEQLEVGPLQPSDVRVELGLEAQLWSGRDPDRHLACIIVCRRRGKHAGGERAEGECMQSLSARARAMYFRSRFTPRFSIAQPQLLGVNVAREQGAVRGKQRVARISTRTLVQSTARGARNQATQATRVRCAAHFCFCLKLCSPAGSTAVS